LIVYVSILVILNSPLMQNDPHTDNIGHLGGFITGILVGFAITE
jgi:membrane associated rhomboid family serine protease